MSAAALAFPASYDDAMFVGDWATGQLRAIRLPGADGDARIEPFLRGTPLPICDVVAGRDGALYFVTGGRGLKSAVYRVYWEGDEGERGAPPSGDGDAPRAQRRALERFHGRRDPAAVDEAWPHLASDDPYVRNAARRALESQPHGAWRERALGEPDRAAFLQAALALARTGDATLRAPLLERLAREPWDDAPPRERADLCRVYDRVLTHLGPLTDAERAALLALLAPRFPCGDDAVDRALAELLVALRAPLLPERLLRRIDLAASQEEAIHYGFLLRLVRDDWSAERRERYFEWLGRAVDEYRGGESLRNYLLGIRDEALAGLTAAERAQLGDLADTIQASPPVTAMGAPFVRDWTMEDVSPHLPRVDAGRDLERGRAVYERATCLDCHRIGTEGGADGPDLTQAAGRFSKRDLLEAILAPNAVIPDQYRDVRVETKSGRTIIGTIVAEDEDTLTVRTQPPSEVVVVAQEDVESRAPTELSRMPEGLLQTFELEEILDLLAYVLEER